jgi:hypothetical protein
VLFEARARELAEDFARKESASLAPSVIELERGWYFALEYEELPDDELHLGALGGVVVNKETGRIFELGTRFPLERDLRLYDRGMDARRHDLVVVEVADLGETVAILQRIAPQVVELSYEAETVWRIPRELTEGEIRDRLAQLPAIFPEVGLYFTFEAVEEARSSGCCEMKLLPRSS